MKSQLAVQEQKEGIVLQASRSLQHVAVRPVADHTVQPEPAGALTEFHFGRDLSQVAVHAESGAAQSELAPPCPVTPTRCPFGGACHTCPTRVQAKLAVNQPGDEYEQEADRVSEQVVRMEAYGDVVFTGSPAGKRLDTGTHEESVTKPVRRLCAECEGETLQPKVVATVAGVDRDLALRHTEAKVNAVSGGQQLTNEQREFFGPRFGVDFSSVRIHTDGSADAAARAVGAHAYTRGSHIVFRRDRYDPHSYTGRQLLAHELAHVVQQGTAPRNQYRSVNENVERHVASNGLHLGIAHEVVRRWPGDNMDPPGDCGGARYLVLRGSVATAKAVVSTLGACSAGDNCLTLAVKIAAIAAEIGARVALMATCFRGGDTDHRQQVQDKINMMNRCYRFFSNSNCDPALIEAMAAVVEAARGVIAALATAVAIALVVALIAAIILLAKVIVAAIAAVGAAAAGIATAAAAVIALLVLIKSKLPPEETSGA
jgi:hypothetical protein